MILNLITAEPHKFSATVTVTYPSGATCKLVNYTTSEETTASTTTGSYTFSPTVAGTYYVIAIENGGDQRTAQSSNFTVSDGGSYSKTLTFPEVQFSATVGVTFPAGLTCSLTDGTTTLYSSGTSGTYNFTVPNAGTWTASASGCGSESVTVTTKGAVYSLALRANVTVTIVGANNGSGVTYDAANHSVSGYTVSINNLGKDGRGFWNIQKVMAGCYAYLHTQDGSYYYECYLTAKTDYHGDQEYYNGRIITPCSSHDLMIGCCAEDTQHHFVAIFRRLKELA